MINRKSIPWILTLLLLCGVALFGAKPQEASADFADESVSSLAKYGQSGATLTLRLMALEALRKETGTAVDDELLAIAKGSDFRMAAYCSAAFGKRRSAASRANLRKILEDTKLKKEVRTAAMNAIATHFKTSGDLTYLWSKAASDAGLQARYYWLKKHIY